MKPFEFEVILFIVTTELVIAGYWGCFENRLHEEVTSIEMELFVWIIPRKESHRFKMIGYCSVNRTLHTFSINDDNVGYPVTLNFEPAK